MFVLLLLLLLLLVRKAGYSHDNYEGNYRITRVGWGGCLSVIPIPNMYFNYSCYGIFSQFLSTVLLPPINVSIQVGYSNISSYVAGGQVHTEPKLLSVKKSNYETSFGTQ